ncbi:MAG TPA: hypothetical protein VEP28_12285 [Rubrobacter sp.]|nr:hypothetical protein [Rubrobacter sp.]
MTWHRKTFAVHLQPDFSQAQGERAALVSGLVSGPFGIYSGSAYRVEPGRFTLVHLPSQVAKLTLPRQSLCRAAAREFAALDLAWESAWAPGVTGPDLDRARQLLARWKGAR